MPYAHLDPNAAAAALAAAPQTVVLDVRTPMEFTRHRIAGATLLPIAELLDRIGELDAETAYLVVCEHGVRSRMVCDHLVGLGYSRLTNLSGGMANWVASGLPVVRG
jgi:rhodanese-related sulfurtransferase